MRSTSIEAYNTIKHSGLLSKRRFQVYEIIHKYGPMTIAEIILKANSQDPVANPSTYSGRPSELERMEVIEVVREGDCPVTGRKAMFWRSTANLPKKLDKRKSKLELAKEENQALRERVAQLEEILIGNVT